MKINKILVGFSLLCFGVLVILLLRENWKEEAKEKNTEEIFVKCSKEAKDIEEMIKLYNKERQQKGHLVSDSLFQCILYYLLIKKNKGEPVTKSELIRCLGKPDREDRFGQEVYLEYAFYEKLKRDGTDDTICISKFHINYANEHAKTFYMDVLE